MSGVKSDIGWKDLPRVGVFCLIISHGFLRNWFHDLLTCPSWICWEFGQNSSGPRPNGWPENRWQVLDQIGIYWEFCSFCNILVQILAASYTTSSPHGIWGQKLMVDLTRKRSNLIIMIRLILTDDMGFQTFHMGNVDPSPPLRSILQQTPTPSAKWRCFSFFICQKSGVGEGRVVTGRLRGWATIQQQRGRFQLHAYQPSDETSRSIAQKPVGSSWDLLIFWWFFFLEGMKRKNPFFQTFRGARVAEVPLFLVLLSLENPEGHHNVQAAFPRVIPGTCTSCMLDLTNKRCLKAQDSKIARRLWLRPSFPCFKRPNPTMRNLHLWPHAAMENNNYTCFTIVESQNSVLPMEYFRSWEQV